MSLLVSATYVTLYTEIANKDFIDRILEQNMFPNLKFIL